MATRYVQTLLVAVSLAVASLAFGQQSSTAAHVIEGIGFERDYGHYVDWTIDKMDQFGLIGSTGMSAKDKNKLRRTVRRFLLDERQHVTALLELGLIERRSEAELGGVLKALSDGGTLDDLPSQVGNTLRTDIYSAMSAYALVTAMGDTRRRPTY